MAGLQGLEEEFAADGFHVLGFISDDFDQAGSDGQIDACTEQYGITFPQFSIGHVIEPNPQPVFQWVLAQPAVGPDTGGIAPTWNFHKYLVSKNGDLVAHFPREQWPGDNPDDPNDNFDTNPVVVAIKAELAK